MLKVEIVGVGVMRVHSSGGHVQDLLLYVISVQNPTAAWTVSLPGANDLVCLNMCVQFSQFPPTPPPLSRDNIWGEGACFFSFFHGQPFLLLGLQVYRRVATFQALAQHLASQVPGLPTCPPHSLNPPSGQGVEDLRAVLQTWMQRLIAVPAVINTPVMTEFLSAEANQPPPGLDISWVRPAASSPPGVGQRPGGGAGGGGGGSGDGDFDDEMEMDERFDRHLDAHEDGRASMDGRDSEGGAAAMGGGGAWGGGGGGSWQRGSHGGYGGSAGGGGGRMGGSYGVYGGSGASPPEGGSMGSFPVAGGWQPIAPGVAHSFTQRNGMGGEFGDDDDDSDFDESDRFEAEALEAGADIDFDGHPSPASLGTAALAAGVASGAGAVPVEASVGGGGGVSGGTGGLTRPGPLGQPGGASPGEMLADSHAGEAVSGTARVALDSFKVLRVIGKGSFGKVFLVREKTSSQIFAMKVLRKGNIIKRNQVEHTRTERSVLGYVRHPFIVGLKMAFQTRDKLFFVLDYCAGGELFFHLGKLGKFPEVRARFYAAEIALALGYIHQLDIIYRDLKPENVSRTPCLGPQAAARAQRAHRLSRRMFLDAHLCRIECVCPALASLTHSRAPPPRGATTGATNGAGAVGRAGARAADRLRAQQGGHQRDHLGGQQLLRDPRVPGPRDPQPLGPRPRRRLVEPRRPPVSTGNGEEARRGQGAQGAFIMESKHSCVSPSLGVHWVSNGPCPNPPPFIAFPFAFRLGTRC
jgi:hypothetical protein